MKKYKSVIILVFCSLVPLLFTSTIPFAAYTRMQVGSSISNEHGWTGEQKLYVIALESGSEYTIIMFSGPWSMDVSIRIGETPYMINGLSCDSGSSHGETMHFTASKSGDYYIQIKVNSGSGFFYLIVELGITDPATGANTEFFDISYLLVLLLPSIFILAIGLLILKMLASRTERKPSINIYKKEYWEKKTSSVSKDEIRICESCGAEINKNLKKCLNCGAILE